MTRKRFVSGAVEATSIEEPTAYGLVEGTLLFMMGELPFVTGVYETARHQADHDMQAPAIDGVKQLLMSARASYMADLGTRGRRITPFCCRRHSNTCAT